MNTYSITLANGREMIVVADGETAALVYAQRTTMTRPLVAKLVRDEVGERFLVIR